MKLHYDDHMKQAVSRGYLSCPIEATFSWFGALLLVYRGTDTAPGSAELYISNLHVPR